MFASKKELAELKREIERMSASHNQLTELVLKQQQEIYELKNPKEPEYFG